MLRIFVLSIVCLGFVTSTWSQVITITGKVLHAETKEILPFANVTTIESQRGTATNGDGEFALNIKKQEISDTMLVSFIGFESLKMPMKELKTSGNVFELYPASETLDEFVLSPLTAHEFMREVVREIPNNITQHQFSALGYYSDKAKENEGYLGQNEAVIKSYFPNFSDTSSSNQHQVVLYNERKDLAKLEFMAKKLKKEERKYKEELEEKGDDTTEVKFLDPRTMFGGLNNVMEAMYIDGTNTFLDTTEFNKYSFEYHNKPIYTETGEEITLIHAKTKRRLEGFKAKGKIYIDRKSLAIVKMEFKGDFKIPLLIRPVLLFMGIGIKKPKLHYARSFQKIDGAWYPKEIFYTINLNLIEKKLFKENIDSMFKLQQAYSIQQINIESPTQIEENKRYSEDKTLAEQVFPDPAVDWSSIQKVQF